MLDVVDLIIQDHRELERLLNRLEDEPASRPAVLPLLATLLRAHRRAEVSEIYPATAAEDIEVGGLREYRETDRILDRLDECDPAGEEFEVALADLADAVTRHLEEDEETVLPHLHRTLDEAQLDALARDFLTSREEHLGAGSQDLTKGEIPN